MPKWMKDLLEHLHWADATMWTAVLECEDAGEDEKLIGWLYHLHVVQHAFVRIWRSEALDLPEASDLASFSALEPWAREGHGNLDAYLLGLSGAELERELAIPWTDKLEEKWGGPIEPVTLAESVLQVAMHTAHHRGQVAARLRDLGSEPPLVDFIAWIWRGRPRAQWPAL